MVRSCVVRHGGRVRRLLKLDSHVRDAERDDRLTLARPRRYTICLRLPAARITGFTTVGQLHTDTACSLSKFSLPFLSESLIHATLLITNASFPDVMAIRDVRSEPRTAHATEISKSGHTKIACSAFRMPYINMMCLHSLAAQHIKSTEQ